MGAKEVAAGAADLGDEAFPFLADELLIRLNLPPHCRLSPLSFPLIPFRERTEAWRIDANACALAHTLTHTRLQISLLLVNFPLSGLQFPSVGKGRRGCLFGQTSDCWLITHIYALLYS